MAPSLSVGSRIRPYGALNFGTAGCFAVDASDAIHLVTCDHVINNMAVPEDGTVDLYFPLEDEYQGEVALFEGKGLVDESRKLADLAAARTLVDVGDRTLLPEPLPGSGIPRFTGLDDPHPGIEVLIWGARTNRYRPGVVLRPDRKYSWPHGRYGAVAYEYQFSVVIGRDYVPEVGDSGGYVVTTGGRIVGLLAAVSGTVTESGNGIVHCVPLRPCLEALGLQLALA